ncbi:hypothetical protein IQ268_22660 [Oculatella sp. LEGE 06141]|uniref:hypothetical protein n=1 Tax=Oculatella sp. LEGE 06141 TaxID=1828648 RepID=UPI0018817F22|nr:hypothetical protein [Oculatella sp. LEGE 06141]MBE9181367.1 hypothetical protein [Oculatella sp. LEGE 06141]
MVINWQRNVGSMTVTLNDRGFYGTKSLDQRSEWKGAIAPSAIQPAFKNCLNQSGLYRN